ncbi:MAG TPA: HNH endonuclease [Magnetospirillum sp.]|nr:HNH endonuclease [Magnetospirillum sp.]
MSETFPLRYEGGGISKLMRYVEMIPFSTCWYWSAYCDAKGYGRVRHNGEMLTAHRFSYEVHHGPIPEGMQVCHSCDVRSCVNPAHLFLGTQLDNIQDMVAKGRHSKGETHAHSKLTSEQVSAIRAKRLAGQQIKSIAEDYGIHNSQVSKICTGKQRRVS